MSKCKYCGAELKWIRTAGGKRMPCDPEPIPYRYQLGARERIVTPNGEVLPCELDIKPEEAEGSGYLPHFATCKGGIVK